MTSKLPLRERRRIREKNRARRQDQLWQDRFGSAATPLDLLGLGYSLLRTRLVQLESRAAKAVARAEDDRARAAAQERLAAARSDVERICGEVTQILAETANQLDMTRR